MSEKNIKKNFIKTKYYKIDILKTLNKKISDENFDKILELKNINKDVVNILKTETIEIFDKIYSKLFNKG